MTACRIWMFFFYLNFVNSDKVSVLLNNIAWFQGMAIFEPGEGGRWHSRCRAFQLQGTVHCDCDLFWRVGAGHLWRLWKLNQMILAPSLTSFSLENTCCVCDYQAQWGWRFLCCFLPDYWPRSYRGQHLKGQHLATGVSSPVHRTASYGAEKGAGLPLTKWVWGEEHPGLHRIASLRTPGLL